MADSVEQKIRMLTDAYRSILARYEHIEKLSVEERTLLRNGEPVARVNDLLRQKQARLDEIRVEEEGVGAARNWWKKTRRSLPRTGCEELLSLLDAISHKVEATLALEAECRTLLDRAVSWGQARDLPNAGTVAAIAYARAARGESS